MPIIVDEVIISVEVSNTASGGGAPPNPVQEKQALVEACAERVLEILRQKAER